MDLEEARSRVTAEVDSAAAAVAGEADVEPLDDLGDAPCHDAMGAPTEEVDAAYEVEFKLGDRDMDEVVAAIRARWEEAGLEVADTVNADAGFPAVYASGEGFNYSLVGVRSRKVVRIGGSTPCLPPSEG